MSKSKTKAVDFFQKASAPSDFEEKFEGVESSQTKNFRAEFIAAPLTRAEDSAIQQLFDMPWANTATNEQVSNDHKDLLSITTEIRAIERQSVLMHGERIRKAQEILKKYKKGAFTEWLLLAYGNRQTPYRMLNYYEYFKSLPATTGSLLEAMPKKAAYVLAAKEGNEEKKIEIIKNHHTDDAENIIQLVQEIFPIKSGDGRKRKEHNTIVLDSIRANLMMLIKRKNDLTDDNIAQLAEMRVLIDEILADQKQEVLS